MEIRIKETGELKGLSYSPFPNGEDTPESIIKKRENIELSDYYEKDAFYRIYSMSQAKYDYYREAFGLIREIEGSLYHLEARTGKKYNHFRDLQRCEGDILSKAKNVMKEIKSLTPPAQPIEGLFFLK